MVEILVALLVASFIAVAAVGVVMVVETGKRRTITSGDVQQVASYVQSWLDRTLRSAGSGFTQSAAHAYGCAIHAARAGTRILPRPSGTPLPAPFADVDPGVPGVFRLAPVVIAQGQTEPGVSGQASDVLIVMSGQGGQSEAWLPFADDATATTLRLTHSIGVAPNDLLLVADRQPVATGTAPCLVTQVSASFDPTGGPSTVALAGTYHSATIETAVLTEYSNVATAIGLGNATTGNPPTMQLIGVGDDSTLFSYDLLQTDASPLEPIADGVFELHALYGLDTDGDRRLDRWAAPAGDYAVSALMDGSAAAAQRLRTIVAVRVGLILRTTRLEDTEVAPRTLTLFGDLGNLALERQLDRDERRYRYRTVESTVPLRNLLFRP